MRESAPFSGETRRSLRRHQGMWFIWRLIVAHKYHLPVSAALIWWSCFRFPYSSLHVPFFIPIHFWILIPVMGEQAVALSKAVQYSSAGTLSCTPGPCVCNCDRLVLSPSPFLLLFLSPPSLYFPPSLPSHLSLSSLPLLSLSYPPPSSFLSLLHSFLLSLFLKVPVSS